MTRDALLSRVPEELHELAHIMDEAAAEHFEHGATYKVQYRVFDDGDYALRIIQRLETKEDLFDIVKYSPDQGKVLYRRRRGGPRGRRVDTVTVTRYDAPRRLFDGHRGGDIGRD